MALSINKTLTTAEGFEVSGAFAFLNIYLINDNWVNISYFKSEADWLSGKQSLNLPELPSRVSTNLTVDEFWGDGLMTLIHDKCKVQIEEVTGEGTVSIVTTQSAS
jgi:hypothetical protein